jgi:hypothetical protein
VVGDAAIGAPASPPAQTKFSDLLRASPGPSLRSFDILPFYEDIFRQFVLRKSNDEIAKLNGSGSACSPGSLSLGTASAPARQGFGRRLPIRFSRRRRWDLRPHIVQFFRGSIAQPVDSLSTLRVGVAPAQPKTGFRPAG